MTTYAPIPAYADHKADPRVLLLVVAGHAALIGAVMAAKSNLPQRLVPRPITVQLIPERQPPPPTTRPQPHVQHPQSQMPVGHPQPLVAAQKSIRQQVDTSPVLDLTPPSEPIPLPLPPPQAQPPRTGPRFATPASDLKPPYPQQKLLSGEEAVLRLKLTIDAEGRVIGVDPVGYADAAFLAAARKHILAHWRYQPATQGGRPAPSSTVITLRFQLDQ